MSAGPMFTTQNSVGFSGLGRSVLLDFAPNKTLAYANSGSQTIASGQGVLLSVIGLGGGSLLSGVSAGASLSGVSIVVVDGVSGVIPIRTSGGSAIFASNTAGIMYAVQFGNSSGASNIPTAPPTVTAINAVFRSGLVAVCSGGAADSYAISLVWAQAV